MKIITTTGLKKLWASITGDANTVDAYHAATSGADAHVLATDANGNATISAQLTSGNVLSGGATINDDTAISFTPTRAYGVMILHDTAGGTYIYAIVRYRTVASVTITSWVAGSAMAVTTGALNGTTGTDGKVTISVHTDGKIYIENRYGSSRTVTWCLLC